MKKFVILLSFLVCSSLYADGTISGGVAIATGEGSENMNTGYNIGASFFAESANSVTFGGHVAYNYWTIDIPDMFGVSIDASISYIELLIISRINSVMNETTTFFFEPGAGLFIGTVSASVMGMSDSESINDFGISLAGGFRINKFEIKPEYKIVFTEENSTKWFTITLGIAL